MIIIPNEKGQFSQVNEGDIKGNIWATWNVDFLSSPGRIRISPQTSVVMSDATYITGYNASFGVPIAATMSSADGTNIFWVATTGGLYKTNSTSALSTWHSDGLTGSPTDILSGSDMTQFNSALLVVRDTGSSASIARLSSSWNRNWWVGTVGGTAFTTGIPHPLCVAFNNFLLIGDGNNVAYVETDGTHSNARIILGTEYEIQWIRSSNSVVYIGARNKNGGRAKIFGWDGSSDNFNWDYKLNGSYTLSGVIKNEICYTIDETGQVYAFTGGGFTSVGQFPNFNVRQDLRASSSIPVSKNGMAVSDDKVHILLSSELTGTGASTYGLENMRSGVWCLDPKIGLHHKYSLTAFNIAGSTTSVADYGQPDVSTAGVLFPISRTGGEFIMGGTMTPDQSSSSKNFLLTQRELETETTTKLGYFVTPKIQAEDIEEEWQKIVILIKKFLYSTDKIVVKYRTDKTVIAEDATLNIGTWTSTTTFTSTADLSSVSAGNEIEILQGHGAGLSTHVSSIVNNAGTYTVTIDETMTSATGGMRFSVWNWTKIPTSIATQGQRWFDLSVGQNSSWVQFKVMGIWRGRNEIEKIFIKNKPKITI